MNVLHRDTNGSERLDYIADALDELMILILDKEINFLRHLIAMAAMEAREQAALITMRR